MGQYLHTRPKLGGTDIISVSSVNAQSERLTDLIGAAFPGLQYNLVADGNDITGDFASTLDGAEQQTLADIISGFVPAGFPGELPDADPLLTMLAMEPDDIVALWPFDGTAPGVDDVRDAGPAALHGNSSGSDASDFGVEGPNATITDGMRFQIAGADEHVVLPAAVAEAITGTDDPFTLLGWFKINTATNKDCLFSIGDLNGSGYSEIAIRTKNSTGALQGIITNDANGSKLINTIGTFLDGEWHMVALINVQSNGRRLRIWNMGAAGENIFSGSTITNSFQGVDGFFGRSAKQGSVDYGDNETSRWGLWKKALTDEQLDTIAIAGGWLSEEAALDAAVLALAATPQYWKLDDAEGLVFADSGPLAADMTESGGDAGDFQVTGPTAIITKAFRFDGTNNRGTVNDQAEFDPADKFSAMLWVDNGGASQSARWLFGHNGGGIGWQFMTEGTNDIKVRIDNGANIKMYIIPGVMDGDPHHIAFTYGPADVLKVFKDGAEIVSPVKARDDTMTTILHPTGPLNIGRKDTGSWAQFDGAHAIMAQEVFTPAQITDYYEKAGGV